MGILVAKRVFPILLCLILSVISTVNAQIKKGTAESLQEQTESKIETESAAKESSRLITIEGIVKAPSPKVKYLNLNRRLSGSNHIVNHGKFQVVISIYCCSPLIGIGEPEF